jgi:CheY-like chemotaxis protein
MISSMSLDVLVVDDDPWFRTVARRLLESGGFNVVGEAESASEARAMVAELSPAAVLLDPTRSRASLPSVPVRRASCRSRT